MWIYAVLALFLILIIFFLSRSVYRQIYLLFYRVGKHRSWAIHLLLLVFLPGTIVHELSHFLAATFLGVRTGTINLIPQIKEEGQVIAGETQIAQCDPIRYSLIGIAPFVSGILLIYSVGRFLLFGDTGLAFNFFSFSAWISLMQKNFSLLGMFSAFFLFWVSNTMFSSKKDLELLIVPLIFSYIVLFALYFLGLRVSLIPSAAINYFLLFLKDLSGYLFFALIINFSFFLVLLLLNKAFSLLAKRH